MKTNKMKQLISALENGDELSGREIEERFDCKRGRGKDLVAELRKKGHPIQGKTGRNGREFVYFLSPDLRERKDEEQGAEPDHEDVTPMPTKIDQPLIPPMTQSHKAQKSAETADRVPAYEAQKSAETAADLRNIQGAQNRVLQKQFRPAIRVLSEFERLFKNLTHEEIGEVLMALMAKQWHDKKPALTGKLEGIFLALWALVERDNEAYKDVCNKRRE